MSRCAGLVLSMALALCAPALLATPPDPRIEHVLGKLGGARAIQETQLSPDGRRLAWVIEMDGKLTIELATIDGRDAHRIDAATGASRCDEHDLAWAPDSHHLAYVADCGASAAQRVIRVVDLEAAASSTWSVPVQGGVQALSWSTDGRRLGFLYVPHATRQASSSAPAKPSLNEIGVGDVDVQQVAVIEAGANAPRSLTDPSTYVYEFAWSPDSQRIAYIAAPPPGDNNWWIAKLYTQDAKLGAVAKVLVDPAIVDGSLHGLQMAVPRWSPDGSRLAFIGGLMSGTIGGDIYSVPAAGGKAVDLTPAIDVTPVWFSWTRADTLLVAQIKQGRSQIVDYDVAADKATSRRVLQDMPAFIGDGSAEMALSLSRDGASAAYMQSSYTKAPEIYAGVLAAGPLAPVTTFNVAITPFWGKAESVSWHNQGRRIQGWLMYPSHYDAGKTYPMIVMVHGGPASAVVPYWPGISFGGPASFSSMGYFVFMPNPRGSFGEGESYVQANRRDFGHGDLSDILAGIDSVEQKLPVDDKRLGLIGWSYGGFMSMFIPTQTQRFRAVVAGAGIADWQSYYGQNQIGRWMIPYFGASVYDDPAAYAKISAINSIKRYKAPTLILVGDSDEECPAAQSFEFWHALRAQNVPTSFVVYPNEGHAFADPQHRIDLLRRSLQWFGRYLSNAD